jgi:peptidoglycan biosynthesis protein MviN/MurJ (putative lipid II flippase)
MGYLLYGIYLNHSIWYKLNDLTKYGISITLTGAIITILINMLLIPVYGYMASAWAHVVSYGGMIVMSFILAQRHYRIEYKMGELLTYFIMVIGMVTFSRIFEYESLTSELVINTGFIIIFLIFAQYKDQIFTVFFKRENK